MGCGKDVQTAVMLGRELPRVIDAPLLCSTEGERTVPRAVSPRPAKSWMPKAISRGRRGDDGRHIDRPFLQSLFPQSPRIGRPETHHTGPRCMPKGVCTVAPRSGDFNAPVSGSTGCSTKCILTTARLYQLRKAICLADQLRGSIIIVGAPAD